nr:hypothetical protein [Tanacetum cinerariifolium]
MEIDIEEDENEPEMTYTYEEIDPLNLSPPASESKPDDEIKVENPIEHEDETVPASVHSVEKGTAAMGKLVEKLGNTKDKVACKKLKKELKEARGFMLKERPNEAINVPIEDEKSYVSEPIMPPKSAPMTQAAIRQMIKDNVNAAIAAERARQANVKNDASGSGPTRGQDAAPTVRECTFSGFMKCNRDVFRGVEGAVELRRWFEKTKSVFEISECA